jgi:hypothetical protein
VAALAWEPTDRGGGQLPDFVAVDSYGIRNTIAAIDTLNGVGD